MVRRRWGDRGGWSHAAIRRLTIGGTLLCLLVSSLTAQQPEPTRAPAPTAGPHGTLAIPCATCHSANAWKPARIAPSFRHADQGFPLENAHAALPCAGCHRGLDFKQASATCSSCHRDVHRGEVGLECGSCHNTRDFADPAGFARRHALTRFPLEGAHGQTDCTRCHTSRSEGALAFRGVSTDCATCHRADRDRTRNPDHAAAGFAARCDACHTQTAWTRATFDHGTTSFALTGAHQAVTCSACHVTGTYATTPGECAACHASAVPQTGPTPHRGFPSDCASCHTTAAWTGARFDHAANTSFALTGAHLATTCEQCHGDGVFAGKPATCVSCHQSDWSGTTNPAHQPARFPTTCADCHSTTTWPGVGYDHKGTAFPLTGAHLAAACRTCHADGVYDGKPTTCVSCHQTDFGQTTNPPHQAAGFATTCSDCHTTVVWTGASFNHATTSFPLTGAHQAATCQSCHADGVYDGRPTTCVSCHQPDFGQTTNPPHQAAGFPTTCADCHSTATWTGASFSHATTSFPLTGAHQAVPCQRCHGDGIYDGKPATCVSCHQTDFGQTTNPPHQAAGFPSTCTDCHTTTTWTGASFDHAKSSFPLTGAHVAATCQSCHADGVYDGKPTTCVSCHQQDFTTSTNPNHQTARFPTTCATCHTTVTWTGATFDHDGPYFPVYSGTHRGRWNTCADCHANSANYAAFTCLTCHEHRKSEMDDKHKSEAGYSYTSTACYSCHPRGTH